MKKVLQQILLVLGVIALIALIVDIIYSVAVIAPSSTPAKVITTKAGPYPLTVNLSRDPALAGYSLPFSITSTEELTYNVTTLPGIDVDATPVKAQISSTSKTNEIQGTAELTVQGTWFLKISVNGSQGMGATEVALNVVAPFAIPVWTGWLIGGIFPIGCFIVFLFLQRPHKRQAPTIATPNL